MGGAIRLVEDDHGEDATEKPGVGLAQFGHDRAGQWVVSIARRSRDSLDSLPGFLFHQGRVAQCCRDGRMREPELPGQGAQGWRMHIDYRTVLFPESRQSV